MTTIDTTTFINNINSTQSSSASSTESSDEIGKEEFLTMLVAQLQNQDPTDPMSSDDFAINLAQFSQLEQLININNTLEDYTSSSSTDSISSMASYLGREIVFDSNSVNVSNGEADNISFDLSENASSVLVELLNSNGTTMGEIELDEMSKGHCCVDLGHVAVANGDYEIRVTATSESGTESNPTAYRSGIVDGYIPGDTPTLLVNGSETTLDNIKEVRVANVAA